MSKTKISFGIFLIILMLSTLLITAFPTFYSNDKAGKIYKEVDTNFNFLKNEDSQYVLMYFGYVGCTHICIPALSELTKVYEKLDKNKFTFYFVNLQADIPEKNVDEFAKYFNKSFKGIYLNNREIKEIINILNVKYVPSILDKQEIQHSGFLHLLEKKRGNTYQQKFLYTASPFQVEHIIKDLNNIKGTSL